MEQIKKVVDKINERFGTSFEDFADAIDFALTTTETNAIGFSSSDATEKMRATKEICINVGYKDASEKADAVFAKSIHEAKKDAELISQTHLQQAKKYSDDLFTQYVNSLTQSVKELFAQFLIDVDKKISEKTDERIIEVAPKVIETAKEYCDKLLSDAVFASQKTSGVATAWAYANLESFKKRIQKEIENTATISRISLENDELVYDSSNGKTLRVDVSQKKIVDAFARLQGDSLIGEIVEFRNIALAQLNVLKGSELINVQSANSGTLML